MLSLGFLCKNFDCDPPVFVNLYNIPLWRLEFCSCLDSPRTNPIAIMSTPMKEHLCCRRIFSPKNVPLSVAAPRCGAEATEAVGFLVIWKKGSDDTRVRPICTQHLVFLQPSLGVTPCAYDSHRHLLILVAKILI